MPENIEIIAGHCSVLNLGGVLSMGYGLNQMNEVTKPYKISFRQRGGAWKPRTESQTNKKRNFEGVGPIGLEWLAKSAKEFGIPIATEIMYAGDLVHFFHRLDPLRDIAWAGARDNMNYALLAYLGLSPFNILLKSPLHGINTKEAKGSLDRITYPTEDENIITDYKHLSRPYPNSRVSNPNKQIIYCIRGQSWPIGPDGRLDESQYERLLERRDQHRGSRNVNNVASIQVLREHPYFQEHGIKLFYDPSHVFGGEGDIKAGITPNQMRKLIGEYAIMAIKEFEYDGLMIEVNDTSKAAKTDKEQALVTTYNGIDYSETNMGTEPSESDRPFSLVEIVKELINIQFGRGLGVPPEKLKRDLLTLDNIRWNSSL